MADQPNQNDPQPHALDPALAEFLLGQENAQPAVPAEPAHAQDAPPEEPEEADAEEVAARPGLLARLKQALSRGRKKKPAREEPVLEEAPTEAFEEPPAGSEEDDDLPPPPRSRRTKFLIVLGGAALVGILLGTAATFALVKWITPSAPSEPVAAKDAHEPPPEPHPEPAKAEPAEKPAPAPEAEQTEPPKPSPETEALQAEVEKLKARNAELETALKKSGEPAGKPAAEEKPAGPAVRASSVNGDDCTVTGKENFSDALKRCIEDYNEASGYNKPSAKKKK